MRKSLLVLVSIVALVFGTALAQDKAEEKAAEKAPVPQYVGVDGCKTCHKSAKSGEQFRIWSEGPHARAYATLASEESAAIAKKVGLKTSAQEAPECLKCHATACGLKAEQIAKDPLKLEDGVQCESCHGAGSLYKKMSTMKDHAKSVAAGLIEINSATCTACHNEESPTYKPFDFKKKAAMIAHPIPAPAEEKAE
jgi:hypothetical protein